MSIPELDQEAFLALLAQPGVTAVDFTAAWCGPCKQLEPVLAALGAAYAGRVRVVAVDVDREPALAQRYDVRSMPTRPRAFLADMLDRALGGDVATASP